MLIKIRKYVPEATKQLIDEDMDIRGIKDLVAWRNE